MATVLGGGSRRDGPGQQTGCRKLHSPEGGEEREEEEAELAWGPQKHSDDRDVPWGTSWWPAACHWTQLEGRRSGPRHNLRCSSSEPPALAGEDCVCADWGGPELHFGIYDVWEEQQGVHPRVDLNWRGFSVKLYVSHQPCRGLCYS